MRSISYVDLLIAEWGSRSSPLEFKRVCVKCLAN